MRPRGIILTNDDKYLLICASDEDTVQVLDVNSHELVGDLPSGPDPELLDLHPSGNPLYVANEDDNLLTVIDINDKKVLAEVEVGGVWVELLSIDGLAADRIVAFCKERYPRPDGLWRKRFYDERLAGLEEQTRGGAPARFSPQRRRRG